MYGAQINAATAGNSEKVLQMSCHPLKVAVTSGAQKLGSGFSTVDICSCDMIAESLLLLRNGVQCKAMCSLWSSNWFSASWQTADVKLTGFKMLENGRLDCQLVLQGAKTLIKPLSDLQQVKYGPQSRDDVGCDTEEETTRRVDLVFDEVTKKGTVKVVINLLFPMLGPEDRNDSEPGFEMGTRLTAGVALGLKELTKQYVVDSKAFAASQSQNRAKNESWISVYNAEREKYLTHGPQIPLHREGGDNYNRYQTMIKSAGTSHRVSTKTAMSNSRLLL
jgi:hypothetical protein